MINLMVAYALIALALVGYGAVLAFRTRAANRALRAWSPDAETEA
jgi:hypothetical protein